MSIAQGNQPLDCSPLLFRIKDSSAIRMRLAAVIADELDALFDVRDGVHPIELVFNGDVAIKALLLQFIQDQADAPHAGAVRHVMAGAELRFVLEMT